MRTGTALLAVCSAAGVLRSSATAKEPAQHASTTSKLETPRAVSSRPKPYLSRTSDLLSRPTSVFLSFTVFPTFSPEDADRRTAFVWQS